MSLISEPIKERCSNLSEIIISESARHSNIHNANKVQVYEFSQHLKSLIRDPAMLMLPVVFVFMFLTPFGLAFGF